MSWLDFPERVKPKPLKVHFWPIPTDLPPCGIIRRDPYANPLMSDIPQQVTCKTCRKWT